MDEEAHFLDCMFEPLERMVFSVGSAGAFIFKYLVVIPVYYGTRCTIAAVQMPRKEYQKRKAQARANTPIPLSSKSPGLRVKLSSRHLRRRRSSQQQSRLLSLPGELRDQIWSLVYGGEIVHIARDGRRMRHVVCPERELVQEVETVDPITYEANGTDVQVRQCECLLPEPGKYNHISNGRPPQALVRLEREERPRKAEVAGRVSGIYRVCRQTYVLHSSEYATPFDRDSPHGTILIRATIGDFVLTASNSGMRNRWIFYILSARSSYRLSSRSFISQPAYPRVVSLASAVYTFTYASTSGEIGPLVDGTAKAQTPHSGTSGERQAR